jgi:hypothetical protein
LLNFAFDPFSVRCVFPAFGADVDGGPSESAIGADRAASDEVEAANPINNVELGTLAERSGAVSLTSFSLRKILLVRRCAA